LVLQLLYPIPKSADLAFVGVDHLLQVLYFLGLEVDPRIWPLDLEVASVDIARPPRMTVVPEVSVGHCEVVRRSQMQSMRGLDVPESSSVPNI